MLLDKSYIILAIRDEKVWWELDGKSALLTFLMKRHSSFSPNCGGSPDNQKLEIKQIYVWSIYEYHKLGLIKSIVYINSLTNKRKAFKRNTKGIISCSVMAAVDPKETDLIKAFFASRFIIIRHFKECIAMTQTKIFLSTEVECIKE